jgi:two-component system CheB/CheR fusion protein
LKVPRSRSHQAKTARPRSSLRILLERGPPRSLRDLPIVGIGASAGGLDACRRLLDALPDGNGMAFILVQHLDPTHESMLVDLLSGHTSMTVRQATDGMLIKREHLYVIPPEPIYLSVTASCTSRNPKRVTVRACLSTFCYIRWQQIAVRAPSA